MQTRIKPTNRVARRPGNAAVEVEKVKKEQLNVKVTPTMRNRVRFSAVLSSDFTQDQITEDALSIYYGLADKETHERQKAVLSKLKDAQEGRLPFEPPLIPNKSSATLTSRGDSASLAAPHDGVVAQLVEHHNGIVVTLKRKLPAQNTTPCKSSGNKRQSRYGAPTLRTKRALLSTKRSSQRNST